MTFASGFFTSSPNSNRSSDILWSSTNLSGKFAIILPAREMSLVSITTPASSVKVLIIGNKEYVANVGASSTFV